MKHLKWLKFKLCINLYKVVYVMDSDFESGRHLKVFCEVNGGLCWKIDNDETSVTSRYMVAVSTG
jgi:hypothetical protein